MDGNKLFSWILPKFINLKLSVFKERKASQFSKSFAKVQYRKMIPKGFLVLYIATILESRYMQNIV